MVAISFFPIFLMLYEFIAYMSNDMYFPAFPIIAESFAVSDALVQLTFTSWITGAALGQLWLGPLSDRIGRRPVLLWGGMVFLASCIGCSLANNILLMIISRFFQGIGVCSMMVAGYAAIHEMYSGEKAVRLLALMSMLSITAPMIGPLAGGYILTYWQWQAIFWIISALAFFAISGLFFIMPESNRQPSLSRLTFKTLWQEYRAILVNRKFMLNATIAGLVYGGMILWIAISPFLLMQTYGFTIKEFGFVQLPIFASFMVGSQAVRLLVDKVELKTLLLSGIIVATFGAVSIFTWALLSNEFSLIIIMAMMIYSLGFGITAAPSIHLSLSHNSANKGAATAIFWSCMMSIGAIGTILSSLFYNNHLMSYAIILLLIIIAALLLVLLEKK